MATALPTATCQRGAGLNMTLQLGSRAAASRAAAPLLGAAKPTRPQLSLFCVGSARHDGGARQGSSAAAVHRPTASAGRSEMRSQRLRAATGGSAGTSAGEPCFVTANAARKDFVRREFQQAARSEASSGHQGTIGGSLGFGLWLENHILRSLDAYQTETGSTVAPHVQSALAEARAYMQQRPAQRKDTLERVARLLGEEVPTVEAPPPVVKKPARQKKPRASE